MFQSLKSVLALASLTSAAAFYESAIAERQSSGCATGLHLMIAGGCGIPCASDVPNLLETLISNITYAFPGTDQYFVPYDGNATQAQVSTPLMIAAFNSYVAECPQTPIVFIGYSLGGVIVMNTLCGGISSSYTANVVASIVYGEETYEGGLSYDVGTCMYSAPKYARVNAASTCAAYAPTLQSYCDSTDPNCCVGGTDQNTHYTYPQWYDVKALQFIISRYSALAAPTSTSSSSVASSTIVPSTSTSTSTGTVTVSTTLSTATSTATTVSKATTVSIATTASTATTAITATTAATVSTATIVSTPSTVTTVSTGTIASGASTVSSASTAQTVTTVPPVTTLTTTKTTNTTAAPYTNSTTTIAGGSSAVSTVPHYSVPSVASSIIPASVSTFASIPNSAILLPSSVEASYLSAVGTVASSAKGAASTAGAVTGSGAGSSAKGNSTSSATATSSKAAVTTYTGAASRPMMTGAVGLFAGLAAYIVA